MKRSVVRRIFLPLFFGTALATGGGWLTFDLFVGPVVFQSARQALRDEDIKGVEARAKYYTVTLRGTVSSPEAREAVQAAVNPTGGWGMRARAEDNRIKVPPTLTMVEISDSGLRAIGWVKDELEREALLDLALRQGGFERDQVDVSEIRVFPYVTGTGAGAISLSTPATAKLVSGMVWLRGFWESLPKVPRIEGNPEGTQLLLRGRVATTKEREAVTLWIAGLRPDLKIDGSGIDLDPKTRPIVLPPPGSAPAPDGWLGPLWTSLTTRPSILFRAGTEDGQTSLSGLIPSSANWVEAFKPGHLPGGLQASPAVAAEPDEDLTVATLAALVKVVGGLHEGFLQYSSTGLTIRGEGDASRLDALRAVDLTPLPPELIHVEVKLPEPGRLSGILDGDNLVLRGIAPDVATRDALVTWIQFVRPDLTIDSSKMTIDPMVIRWNAPPLPDRAGAAFPDIDNSYPWLRKLVSTLRTGPSLHFRAAQEDAPATFSWLGPTELRWASTIAAAAAASGQVNLSTLSPGGRTSPLVSDEAAPAPTNLGQLIGSVASLQNGELIYDPGSGLTVRGRATPAQEQVILTIGAGRMDPAKVHFELAPPPARPEAPRQEVTLGAVWTDSSLSLYGAVPEDAAKEIILTALKEGGHRARIDAGALEVKPGPRFPAPLLVAELANRFVSAPGDRRFSLTETSLNVSGEITTALLRDWKPVLDKFAQAGFGINPKWEIYASVHHFPSHRGGAGLPPASRDKLIAILKANELHFEAGSAEIRDAEHAKITAICAALKEINSPSLKVVVGGHGESHGNPAQNQALNRRRAEAVVEAIIANGGSPNQFKVEDFGTVPETAPAPVSSAQARRVELILQ